MEPKENQKGAKVSQGNSQNTLWGTGSKKLGKSGGGVPSLILRFTFCVTIYQNSADPLVERARPP